MSLASPRAAVLVVGDELISGEVLDRNSSWLSQRLAEHGWRTAEVRVVGDDEERIARAVRELSASAGLVCVAGGLGPTLDDITRHGVARAAGVGLREDAAALETIRAWFAGRGHESPESNARQALFPEGAEVIPNPAGTAPGFRLRLGEAVVYALPGPPAELERIFEAEVAPRLAEHTAPAEVVRSARFYLQGLGESAFADRVGAWMDRAENPRLGVTASGGVLRVMLEARAADEARALALLASRQAEFRERFGPRIFSEEHADPAFAVGALALAAGTRLAVAESCTGGMLAQALTRVPGISAVFLAGYVTYANEVKSSALGVPTALLEEHGAVSPEVAGALARGAAEACGAGLAVSTTGIAGPGGGSPEKPVGTVCFGLWHEGALATVQRRFPSRGRDLVRRWAVNHALDLMRRALLPGPARKLLGFEED